MSKPAQKKLNKTVLDDIFRGNLAGWRSYSRNARYVFSSEIYGVIRRGYYDVSTKGFRTREAKAAAYGKLQALLDELYTLRVAPHFITGYSARYAYDALIGELEAYGFEDRRQDAGPLESTLELSTDEQIFQLVNRSAATYMDESDDELEAMAAALAKDPRTLTEGELELLTEHNPNPYARFNRRLDVRRYHVTLRTIDAVEAALATYDEQAEDFKLVVGGHDGLENRLRELELGPEVNGTWLKYLEADDQSWDEAPTYVESELRRRENVKLAQEIYAAEVNRHAGEATV